MADSSKKKVEKKNNILEAKKEEIESKQEKVDHDKLEEEVNNHDLKMARDTLQHDLDNALREHQRGKENMEREFSQKFQKMNFDHLKTIEDHRKQAVEAQNKPDEKIENMTAEQETLTKQGSR